MTCVIFPPDSFLRCFDWNFFLEPIANDSGRVSVCETIRYCLSYDSPVYATDWNGQLRKVGISAFYIRNFLLWRRRFLADSPLGTGHCTLNYPSEEGGDCVSLRCSVRFDSRFIPCLYLSCNRSCILQSTILFVI